jgi:hypothetical protein
MTTANSSTQWKDVGILEFIGIVLLIPISFIAFNLIIGIMFRGFLQSNSESTFKIILGAFYLCLGCGIAPYIYKFRKSYLIILCSFVVLLLFQVLIGLSLQPGALGEVIEKSLSEIFWVYLSMVLCVLLFRYSEARLDFAEARDVVEKTGKKANKKFSEGICSKCGGVTIVSKERETSGGNRLEFFCDRCGRFVHGNPLPNTVIGLILVTISLLFLYGLNSNNQDSLISAFNLLCLIVLFVGAKTCYSGLRWTLHAISKKQK